MTQQTEQTTQSQEPNPSVSRAEEWASRSVHAITLESGMKVKIRLPDLAILIEGEVLPDRLRGVAAQLWQDGASGVVGAPDAVTGKPTIDMEGVRGLAQLRRHLAALCLVDPPMSADELVSSGVPAEDIDLLASIAMRERDIDAVGVKLGVLPLSRFDTFREEHGCPEDCPACAQVSGRFSTRRAHTL